MSDAGDQRSLGRIEGKLDSLLDEIKRHFDDDHKNFARLDARIGRVQSKVNYFSGAWAVVGAAVVYFLKGH